MSTTASQRWEAAVAAEMEKGKTRAQAVRAVVREQPDLHSEYLDEANANRPAARR